MRTRFIGSIAASAVLGMVSLGFTAVPAQAAPQSGISVAAVTPSQVRAVASSTINQVIAGVGTFAGTFTPTGFGTQNGQLTVTGVVQGALTLTQQRILNGVTYPVGSVLQVTQTVTAVVTDAAASQSCRILSLDLGPLDLNVLGLVIELNRVELDITAVRGAGNLLGNLLCSVVGLLDGANLTGLAALLNRLLGL